MRILLADDDRAFLHIAEAAIRSLGHECHPVSDGTQAWDAFRSSRPDVVISDLVMPGLNGLELCRDIRAHGGYTYFILVSGYGGHDRILEGMNAGADDYLIKPFGSAELLARLRVALRHAARGVLLTAESVHSFGDVRVDLTRRTVHRADLEVHLTPHEYKLLFTLIQHAGKVVTHRQLLREVWGPSVQQTHYLRVYMGQLRQKLEEDPARPRWLATEAGVGYRLRDEPAR